MNCAESTLHYPASYYAATLTTSFAADPLDRDTIADCCIVGGGFTGLGAALALARAGRSVRLVEAGPIGWGASGRNGGQVHLGWNMDQPWFERRLGPAMAHTLWDMAVAARDHLDDLIALDPDLCDFVPGQVHADHKPGLAAGTCDHVRHLRDHYGHDDLVTLDRDQIRAMIDSPAYFGGSLDRRGGHLHPLKLALAMARAAQTAGAVLSPHCAATRISPDSDGWRIETPRGSIRAGQVLVATGGYGKGLVRPADAHILPINNYIATTVPLDPDLAASLVRGGHSVSDSRFVVRYFRVTRDNRLLFGGGETYGTRFPRDIAGFVRPHLARVFPQLAQTPIDYAWGGTLAITPFRLPYGAEIRPGLFVLAGYSGLGVVLAPWLGAAVGAMMSRQPEAAEPDDAFAMLRRLPSPRFPGGPLLRWPTQIAAMSFFALRDWL